MQIKLQTPVQAQLTRLSYPTDLSEKSKNVKDGFQKIIKDGKSKSLKCLCVDLSMLSGENHLLTEDTRPCKKVTAVSSAILNNNYSNVAMDAVFHIDGVTFSKKEVENAQKVLRSSISFLPTTGSNLDYNDYASMGIAINSVSAWADNNLSEEQSSVIKKTIQNYADSLSSSERENQKDMGGSIDDSKYYGATISNDETDKMINQLKEHVSKVTGKAYAPSYGNVVTQQSATNQELTSSIKDLFTNIDLTDEKSVQQAYKKFTEMVTPAYNSHGITNQQNGLNNVLGQNINSFAKQISDLNALISNVGNNGVDITV